MRLGADAVLAPRSAAVVPIESRRGADTNKSAVKSRNALMDAAYDEEIYVDDRTIDSHIKRLRISSGHAMPRSIWSRRFTALAIVSKKYERPPSDNSSGRRVNSPQLTRVAEH